MSLFQQKNYYQYFGFSFSESRQNIGRYFDLRKAKLQSFLDAGSFDRRCQRLASAEITDMDNAMKYAFESDALRGKYDKRLLKQFCGNTDLVESWQRFDTKDCEDFPRVILISALSRTFDEADTSDDGCELRATSKTFDARQAKALEVFVVTSDNIRKQKDETWLSVSTWDAGGKFIHLLVPLTIKSDIGQFGCVLNLPQGFNIERAINMQVKIINRSTGYTFVDKIYGHQVFGCGVATSVRGTMNETKKQAEEPARAKPASSTHGNPQKAYQRGLDLYKGNNGTIDYSRAFSYFQEASSSGLPEALYMAGICKQEGRGTARNSNEAMELFTSAASAGSKDAQLALARRLYDIEGKSADSIYCRIQNHDSSSALQQALPWYDKAAEADTGEALYAAGAMHWCLEGGCDDTLRLIKAAASKGVPEAQYLFARIAEDGTEEGSDKIAFEHYALAAEGGLEEAWIRLGKAYLKGTGVEANEEKGVQWLSKAASKGNCAALNELGCLYSSTGQFAKAADLYRTAVDRGDYDAKIALGDLYSKGLGVKLDKRKAFDLYLEAANERFSVSLKSKLGRCYLLGEGCKMDRVKGEEYLDFAVKYGESEAMRTLATFYRRQGKSEQSLSLFHQASACGNSEAMLDLAHMYKEGIGTEADPEQAFRYIRSAADRLCSAKYQLGMCYLEGDGADIDHTQARHWIERAAEEGHSSAQNQLGELYLRGTGVEQDARLAYDWFLKSAKQSCSGALYNLGICCRDGVGTNKDLEDAALWFSLDKNNWRSLLAYGDMLLKGEGVSKNPEEAFSCYLNVSHQGYAEGLNKVGECYVEGIGTTVDAISAVECFKKAVEQDFSLAQVNLAKCYERGLGCDQNHAKAAELYQSAATSGILEAQNWVASHRQQETALDSLIGLSSLKKQISEWVDELEFDRRRGVLARSSHHMLFLGNAGTGKTRVANIMADLLCDAGIIRTRDFTSVKRQHLVGTHIGDTEHMTDEVIRNAMPGVLFIDEAYSLWSDGSVDYGRHAIEVLLPYMEDPKYWDDLIVIFAGYEDKMEQLLSMNQGLRSRISHRFLFPDYTSSELADIFALFAKENQFEIEESVRPKLEQILDVVSKKSKDFGNARGVRNFFNSVKQAKIRQEKARGNPNDHFTSIIDLDLLNGIEESFIEGE